TRPVENRFTIDNCRVMVEGAGAFFANPEDGTTRVIDLGSRTVNALTFMDKIYAPNGSFTLEWGWDTLTVQTPGHVAEKLNNSLSARWDREDKVIVVGGRANDILDAVKKYFPNAIAAPNP